MVTKIPQLVVSPILFVQQRCSGVVYPMLYTTAMKLYNMQHIPVLYCTLLGLNTGPVTGGGVCSQVLGYAVCVVRQ